MLTAEDRKRIGLMDDIAEGRIEERMSEDQMKDWFKMLQAADDPAEKKAELESKAFGALENGVPPHQMSKEAFKAVYGAEGSNQVMWKHIRDRYRAGKAQVRMMDLGYDILLRTWGDPEAYDKNIKSIQQLQSEASPEGLADVKGFWKKTLGATSEMLPVMIEGIKAGGPHAVVGAVGGGLIAGIGANLVPGAQLTPEEAVTIPAGMKIGASLFGGAYAADRIRMLEAGGMFLELMEIEKDGQRIDPKIAVVASHAVGVINGGFEMVQWATLAKTFGISGKLFNKTVSKVTKKLAADGTIRNIVLKYVGKYGATLSAETAQELGQETTNVVFTRLAKELNNALKGTDFKPVSKEDLIKRYEQILDQSLRSFGILSLPGPSIGMAMELAQQKAKAVETGKVTDEQAREMVPKLEKMFGIEKAQEIKVETPAAKTKTIAPTTAEAGKGVKQLATAEQKGYPVPQAISQPPAEAGKVYEVEGEITEEQARGVIDQAANDGAVTISDRPNNFGLTRDEIKIVGKKLADVMRHAQKKQKKVGYKMGAAENAKKAKAKINEIRLKEKFRVEQKLEALNLIKTYVPKEDQWRYVNRVVRATTSNNVDDIMTAITELIEKKDKKAAETDFRNFIRQVRKDYRGGKVTMGKLRKSVRDIFNRVLDNYDLSKLSEKKEEELESRQEFIRRTARDMLDFFRQEKEELEKSGSLEDLTNLIAMGEKRIEEVERLNKTPISELTAQDIRQLHGMLKHILDVNTKKAESKARRAAENRAKDIVGSGNELVEPTGEISELTGIIGGMQWVAGLGHSTISTIANLITGKENSHTRKILHDDMVVANNERKTLYQKFLFYFRKLAEKAGIKWEHIKRLNDTVDIELGDKKIKATYDSVLALYCHMTADGGNLQALLTTEGLNVEVYEPVYKGLFQRKKIYRTPKAPTLDELRAIAKLVPDIHKKLAEVHFQTNKEVQQPAINKTSMQTENYEKAIYDRYWHIARERPSRIEGGTAELSVAPESQGRYKFRVGGNQRINIKPFTKEVIAGMQTDAKYAAMTEAIENVRTLLANPQWKKKVLDAGMHKAYNELEVMYRRIQGMTTDQNIIEGLAGKVLANVGKSLLSLRPSGMGVQIASVPAFFKFIDKKHFAVMDDPANAKADIKELMEHPLFWLRWKGKQFDYAMGAVGAHKAFQGLLFDHVDTSDKGLAPYTWGDQLAVWKGWKAAQRQIEAQQGKPNKEAAMDLLIQGMESQPQWDMLHRSPITSSPNAFLRGSTMFMSARLAQYNILLQAIDDYRKGRISRNQAADQIGSIGMAISFVALSRRVFRLATKFGSIALLYSIGAIDRPEEEAKEEALRELQKVPRDIIYTALGLNAMGQFFTTIDYGARRRMKWGPMHYSDVRSGNVFADIMFDMLNAGELYHVTAGHILDGDTDKAAETAAEAFDQTLQLVAYRFGLPYEGPKADFIWPLKSVLPKSGRRSKKRSIKQ